MAPHLSIYLNELITYNKYDVTNKSDCCYLLKNRKKNLPHEFSSEPSAQSFSPLQKSPRSIQLPSPQAKKPS